jgi:hypothetical protein
VVGVYSPSNDLTFVVKNYGGVSGKYFRHVVVNFLAVTLQRYYWIFASEEAGLPRPHEISSYFSTTGCLESVGWFCFLKNSASIQPIQVKFGLFVV